MKLTTATAVEMVAYERAPRPTGRSVNQAIVCADGFTVSVQASSMHYAHDSSGEAPYWNLGTDPQIAYPFVTFEVGYPSENPPADVWDEYDSGGVWAWVPREVVADLLDLHGGAVGWKAPE